MSGSPGGRSSASTSSTAPARPRCCTSTSPTPGGSALRHLGPRRARLRAAPRRRGRRRGRRRRDRRDAGARALAAEGYWNQREKSRRTFEGAWTRTGDKYVREADGRFICCGRTDDMFKVSGIWVSPFEVEAALISHDAVLEAAVVPAEDAEGLLSPRPTSSSRAPVRGRRAPRRGAEGARQERHRPVEIPALDRGRRQPAEDRDGEDPAVQAEGGSLRRWIGRVASFEARSARASG